MKNNYYAKIKKITLVQADIPKINSYIVGIEIIYSICGFEVEYKGGIVGDATANLKRFSLSLFGNDYITEISGRYGAIIDYLTIKTH